MAATYWFHEYRAKTPPTFTALAATWKSICKKGYVSDTVVDHPSPPYAGGNAGVAKTPSCNFMMKEASGWGTLGLVPHDVQGLIDLLDGREKSDAKLDEFFNTPYHFRGICRDLHRRDRPVSAGQPADRQLAHYHAWSGQPWETRELLRRILCDVYGSDRYGLAFPGIDEQGSTSSWYVLSAMGCLYRRSGAPRVHHRQHRRRQLGLEMGPAPNKNWGSAPDAAPPTLSAR